MRYCNDEQPNPTREREAAKVVAIVQERGLSSHRIIMGPSPPSRHYSPSFVERGGHRAVAEALNDGQCDALRRVVDASGAGSAGMGECVPLFVYATRGGGGTSAEEGWSLTSLASADAFDASASAMVRRRGLRAALREHGGEDVRRAHAALASRGKGKGEERVVVRLVVVFEDESSHVNALVVGGGVADLFEPRMRWEDTKERPFGSVRAAVAKQLLSPHGVRLAPPAHGNADTEAELQTDDDLCQTWVAGYVAGRAKGKGHAEAVRELRPPCPGCDRLCALLRFSEEVYERVPFPTPRRGGATEATLAARKATTTRPFAGSPGERGCSSVRPKEERGSVRDRTSLCRSGYLR